MTDIDALVARLTAMGSTVTHNVIADAIAALTALSDEIAVLKEREGWQPISISLEGRQCLGVFGAPLDKTRWEGPILGTIRNGEFWNALGRWKGMDLVLPIAPPPARAALSDKAGS